jgi:hypothetical protein
MTRARVRVDLSRREKLLEALDKYFPMGVCPVRGVPFPGAMVDVSLEVLLPGGSKLDAQGRVIQQLGPTLFLVQMSSHLDHNHLRDLATAEPADPTAPEPQDEERPEKAKVTGSESASSAVYADIPGLSVPEKRKLARQGNRIVRQLLVKDPNKALHILVVKNPRMGLDEALEYSKRPNLAPDALKAMSQNRTFLNSRQFIFNLVRNPTTPVDIAVRLLPRLSPNQWQIIARPGSVRTPISAAARKLVMQKLG